MEQAEYSVPVLIAGGGACGAVAALAAHDAGLEPLLIERDPHPTGSTAMSQGLLCAAGTRFQAAEGIEDSPDVFFEDIMKKSRGMANPVIARLLADQSAPVLEWLHDAHDFPWTIDTRFKPSYGNSRARIHGWHDHSGSDMVQWLHRRLSDLGIDVLFDTRLVDLIENSDGRVNAARIQGGDGALMTIGCDAVVLACGGYGANREMTGKYMPETAAFRYYGHESSEGDAIILGEKLGAAVGDMGSYQGYAMLAEPGGMTVPPNTLIEGGVILNTKGERFTDESEDIAGMVLPLSEQPDGVGFLIFDQSIYRQCEHIPEVRALKQAGLARQAPNMTRLAEMTGLPASALQASLREIRQAARRGEEDRLGRSWQGSHAPRGGYYFIRVTGALYHTQGGLEIDDQARVLRSDGRPFTNLFAGGGSARSVSGPSSWGYLPAMGLTTAVTLGSIAGQGAARIAQQAG
ncbi:FAD-dependent oxidoreductase [Henriciella sp. AS95]|uniref:FAD-dependent oxidoreductase n=1 Tax=Henriciella sp. AS95 TaxID=3135782 RepID=UPI003176740B